jgi:hypothetical protein
MASSHENLNASKSQDENKSTIQKTDAKESKAQDEAKGLLEQFSSKLKSIPSKFVKSSKLEKEEESKNGTSRLGENGRVKSREFLSDDIEMTATRGKKLEHVPHNFGLSSMVNACFNFQTEHRLPLDELCAKLQIALVNVTHVSENRGLLPSQVADRQELYGKNVELVIKQPSYLKFIECLTNLFNVLLFAAGTLYLIIYAIEPLNDFESVSDLFGK